MPARAPVTRSHYLTMRDGVRIAIDVAVPADASADRRVPAILHQTRYFRAADWGAAARRVGLPAFVDATAATRAAFLAAGYAWIDVDTRGSGASFGWRPCPWGPDEVADGGEIASWITRQPWSSGAIGATGVSYGGTCAEMLMTARHPAVKAVIPRFSLFDVYTDIAFPGGLHLSWFTATWARYNDALDRNAYDEAFAMMVRNNAAALRELPRRDRARARDVPVRRRLAERAGRLAVRLADNPISQRAVAAATRRLCRGVLPVEGERDAIARAVGEHVRNTNVHEAATHTRFRDDLGAVPAMADETIDLFSPHAYMADIVDSGAAVYGYSGWLDGAYQHAAIKRHLNLPRGRGQLILGPWDHGGRQNISPFDREWRTRFDHPEEMLRFFDAHLRGEREQDANANAAGPAVRYFTMGQERWKTADTWPPPGVRARPWYVGQHADLAPGPAADETVHEYRVDPEAGTGKRSRWRSLVGMAAPIGYGDRAAADSRLLCFTSAPLPDDLEVTGHPVVHLHMSADAPDGAVFAYLEDVAPTGRVTYVTEGMLRLSFWPLPDAGLYAAVFPQRHFRRADAREIEPGQVVPVVFDLLPTSYRFARGHAIRLAIAGADRDHFAPVPGGASTLRVHAGGAHDSRIELPVAG